ncbi:MAG: hypothetical protein F6K48_03135 [Okeania sp. SIO3H1]|nr:hypothetical protein [Okeania sp. SIO3H1]
MPSSTQIRNAEALLEGVPAVVLSEDGESYEPRIVTDGTVIRVMECDLDVKFETPRRAMEHAKETAQKMKEAAVQFLEENWL